MKKTLVIGSTVVDIILNVPSIPLRGDDVNITSIDYRIGGCAYNVFIALSQLHSPAILCSPVGIGIYGRMVREHLEKKSIPVFISLDEENGCCFCLVEPDGERSFLSHHGAEYIFHKSWMNEIDISAIDDIFICGLEVEDPTGKEIIDFVNSHIEPGLYFAPGPRIMNIAREKMEAILARRDADNRGPFLHLNGREALSFSGKENIEEAASFLSEKTNNSLVITLGEKGSYCFSNSEKAGQYIPAFPVKAVNTVGAGDTHCGTLIALIKRGMSLEKACLEANRIASEKLQGI